MLLKCFTYPLSIHLLMHWKVSVFVFLKSTKWFINLCLSTTELTSGKVVQSFNQAYKHIIGKSEGIFVSFVIFFGNEIWFPETENKYFAKQCTHRFDWHSEGKFRTPRMQSYALNSTWRKQMTDSAFRRQHHTSRPASHIEGGSKGRTREIIGEYLPPNGEGENRVVIAP